MKDTAEKQKEDLPAAPQEQLKEIKNVIRQLEKVKGVPGMSDALQLVQGLLRAAKSAEQASKPAPERLSAACASRAELEKQAGGVQKEQAQLK